MKNLDIFEPQIDKHYAYKKTCTKIVNASLHGDNDEDDG